MANLVDSPDVFEKLVLKLNGIVPRIDVVEMVSPLMISKAVYLIAKMNMDIRFSKKVWRYIAVTLFESGHVLLPKWLVPARQYMISLENRPGVREGLEKMVKLGLEPKTLIEKVAVEKMNILLGVE